MMDEKKKFWRSLEEKEGAESYHKDVGSEFPERFSSVSRRNFLKAMGFGMAGSMVACSQIPVEKAIPYLIQPDDIVPGKAYWYASACSACPSQCAILLKTREGRPIKVEGNELSPLNQGGLCAKGQASVLDLYDSGRLQDPYIGSEKVDWNQLDRALMKRFEEVRQRKGKVRLLSGTVPSPSMHQAIDGFLRTFADGQHVVYEPVSYSGLLRAHREAFGAGGLPHYHFDRAKWLVSFGADFLGSWLSPVEFSKDYAKARKVDAGQLSMSRHIQFESRLSMTGANADERIPLLPSQMHRSVLQLAFDLETLLKGKSSKNVLKDSRREKIKAIAGELASNKGVGIVISSSNETAVQHVIVYINQLLENYGQTISVEVLSKQQLGEDEQLEKFLQEVKGGSVEALILMGANPLYDLALDEPRKKAFSNVPLIVSLNTRRDESARLAHYLAPMHHPYESWGDREPVEGIFHLVQPVIRPVFRTRNVGDSLLRWQGRNKSFQSFVQGYWKKNLYPRQSKFATFETFWKNSLRDGVFVDRKIRKNQRKYKQNIQPILRSLIRSAETKVQGQAFELELYESVTVGTGALANNPWLQELPDPVSKVTWDNYASISSEDAKRLKVRNGDVVSLSSTGNKIEVPIYVQPGQVSGSMAIALGYGRRHAGKVGDGVGKNLYPWVQFLREGRKYSFSSVKVKRVGKTHTLALTQTHYSAEGRPIVHALTWAELKAGKNLPSHKDYSKAMLWKAHEPKGQRWGMAIDLSACTGCSSCLVSCQAENNVAVVGKEEVRNRREMSWLRIDRYYSGDETNPDVIFQPMLCQHCGNAPCESVCPVLATVHSSDGLNQQVYNRCIGTRYCANNCPYKVRRFNWFDYAKNPRFDYNQNDPVGRLVLNPDVVVRSRGVMEKCSLCVQRIQEKKLEAKREGRQVDSDFIKTACQQSCPTNAIVFGDLNDSESKVSKMLKGNSRRFHVLAELNVQPSITYMAKVRNKG